MGWVLSNVCSTTVPQLPYPLYLLVHLHKNMNPVNQHLSIVIILDPEMDCCLLPALQKGGF